MTTKMEVVIYDMVKQIPDAINRNQRRQIAAEYNEFIAKLSKVAKDYERELFDRNSFEDENTFAQYNERFQKVADFLGRKARFHGIHRGWFYLMYKPEKIGVMRDEERGSNAFANWTMETIARPFF